jgi:glyoxylase-like metal-dependent hydrolase (beta-lactamase superfamily II)
MNRYYRFGVGSFACTSLLDGSHEYKWQDFVVNAGEEEVRAALKARGMTGETIITPYTYLHIDTGDHQILVDAGAGSFFPTTGLLTRSMAEAEIDPHEIDTVIITHAHPDHIGGLLLPDGSPAYPNALHYICKREWDYWFSDEEFSRARKTRRGGFDFGQFFDFARGHLEPVRRLIRQVEFSGEESTIFPGVKVFRAPGHTPGHMVAELRSNGESLLYIGDAAISPIHLEQPAWLPVYEIEPELSLVSRRFVCDLAASHDSWVVGQHFPPFPSLGHIERRRDAWEWKPVRVEEGVRDEPARGR